MNLLLFIKITGQVINTSKHKGWVGVLYSLPFALYVNLGGELGHRKTRLTKHEKMTIALAEDMARSATDISDELLERWLEHRRFFSV